MTPRKPPESPEVDGQSALPPEVHNALNDITPANGPADEPSATENKQGAPRLVKQDEIDTEVEIDRIEAYLRGPTAFTA
jgi:hypothetical protein